MGPTSQEVDVGEIFFDPSGPDKLPPYEVWSGAKWIMARTLPEALSISRKVMRV